jgi:flavin reductase (DIM6/NTAB) family NADH-FMN oxidoreductase RutF
MIIDPKRAEYKDCYKLMIGSIVPRPIALVSTVGPSGTFNLAPFSYFTAISADPPTICFSPGRRHSDGKPKDTLVNIERGGEFVVNVVTESIVHQMNETAVDYPPEVDEFAVAGFTPVESRIVAPPCIKESPINMECRLYKVVDIGPKRAGGASLVIGEIVMFHVADELYSNGRIDIGGLKPVGRLSGNDYTTLGTRISIPRKRHDPGKS